MSGQYNLRNPAVKRLMKEAQELREPTEQYYAQPLEDNLFEWHFTIRGPDDSEFDGGVYHGRIILPPEYPMKPPSIMLLTPNGRFEIFKKICLSISGHHPESWQPSWSIRTALLAIIGFMPTHGNGAIGSLDYTSEERKVLAKRSNEWKCSECGSMKTILKPVTEASKKTTEEAKELASQINFQGEKDKNANKGEAEEAKSPASTGAESATSSAPSTSTPDVSGAAGSVSSSTTSTPVTPGFPPFGHAVFPANYPGGMPNPAMPPFMPPRMMTPPATPPGAGPPFVRPFWPGMLPTVPPPGTAAMQARPPGMMYPWPPMFNPMMMNAQMMAMMNQHARLPSPSTPVSSSPVSTPSTTSDTAASSSVVTSSSAPTTSQVTTSQPSSPSSVTVTSSVPSPSSSSTSVSVTSATVQQNNTVTSSSSRTPSQASAGIRNSSATTTTTTTSTTVPASSSSASSSLTSTEPAPAEAEAPGSTGSGLRQRTVGLAATRAATPATAPAYATHTPRRGENPAVVMVMALLGLLIIALILRRLYNVVNAGAFDNDF